ncbi:MAG: hypothetical protein ACOCZB_00520 [Spirochaetota bacterium]
MKQIDPSNVVHEDETARGELDFRIRRRDRYSLELKFRHILDPDRERYPRTRATRMRLVFFLPHSFNIRPETMDPEEFYDDVKLYVRFNTPTLHIDEMLEPDSPESPLARICRMLESPGEVAQKTLKYEAQLLGAVTKSALRDAVNARVRDCDRVGQEDVNSFCAMVQRLHEGFSRYRWALDRDDLPRDSLRHLLLVDEDLSLTIENYVVRMLTNPKVERSGASLEPLRQALLAQQRYREERGYASVVRSGSDITKREEYIYRYKILKHYVSSVLFFEIHRGNQARRVEHLLYAVAAGLAMAIATGISFIGQIRFGTLSTTLFLVLVGAYMIKDRIKDAFRAAFQRTLGKLFYDRRTAFNDQSTHKLMGIVKERCMFVRENRLGDELLRTRARDEFELAITKTNPETALEYTKLLHVKERRLHRTQRRITGLADINIIDLKNLLRYLVRQREQVPVVTGDSVELEPTRRIYHLNLLVSADTGHGDRRHKVRLVVDAGGIRRIEYPESAGP